MATMKPHTFTLTVYKAGEAEKVLQSTTNVMTFAAIDSLTAVATDMQAMLESDDMAEAFAQVQESMEPILAEAFADYEQGDVRYMDVLDVISFVEEYSEYLTERLGRLTKGEAKNPRGAQAPRKTQKR